MNNFLKLKIKIFKNNYWNLKTIGEFSDIIITYGKFTQILE